MRDCLILTHGAGSNRDAPLLLGIDIAFRATGLEVIRMNLPYREVRPVGPPRPGDAERDRLGLAEAAERARRDYGRVFLGGHSYGGRQCSILAAARPDIASGLLLLSYPLHPPKNPDQLRTAHLPDLRTAALFVSGVRDPFGSIEELRAAIALAPARTRLIEIQGTGHELLPKRAAEKIEVMDRIVNEFQRFFELFN